MMKVANHYELPVKLGEPKSFYSSPFCGRSSLQNVRSDDCTSHDLLSHYHVELLHFVGQKEVSHYIRRRSAVKRGTTFFAALSTIVDDVTEHEHYIYIEVFRLLVSTFFARESAERGFPHFLKTE
ncbi:hypothetical protein AVEN_142878-1 [Araneus ventricosus]|uniref:Uncharacterized protein n=1 Tax=Araneus ventricosus TaxID=182803 RepID=A0A4Y2MZ22_ARAVE|nr:hypothetical protein AVEN_142878-1 [Araneus ventricosus]